MYMLYIYNPLSKKIVVNIWKSCPLIFADIRVKKLTNVWVFFSPVIPVSLGLNICCINIFTKFIFLHKQLSPS